MWNFSKIEGIKKKLFAEIEGFAAWSVPNHCGHYCANVLDRFLLKWVVDAVSGSYSCIQKKASRMRCDFKRSRGLPKVAPYARLLRGHVYLVLNYWNRYRCGKELKNSLWTRIIDIIFRILLISPPWHPVSTAFHIWTQARWAINLVENL